MNFDFSTDDLHVEGSDVTSRFDEVLVEKWKAAMAAGHFNYTLDDVQFQVVPGERNFIVRHNKKRFVLRRAPVPFLSIDQPFNPDKFNFNKVPPHEEILQLRFSSGQQDQEVDCPVLINVSPLELGHVLVVPERRRCFNQMMRKEAVLASLWLILLSRSNFFYVGYNSLRAHASVNHLHIHGWYTRFTLASCVADLRPMLEDAGLFVFADYPLRGFVFVLDDVSKVDRVARMVTALTDYLHANEMAHNLFVCRGPVPGQKRAVRICIWPRTNCVSDDKGANRYNLAVAEIAGLLICREEDDFNSLDEATITADLRSINLPDEQFKKVQEDLLVLLTQM